MADYISKYETGAAVDAALDLAMSALQPESGKGLSTNDFTNEYKDKVDSNDTEISSARGSYTTVNDRLNAIESEQESQGEALDEDRAALVEIVDSVAKSIMDLSQPETVRDTVYSSLSDGGVHLSCSNKIWTQYIVSVPIISGKNYTFAMEIANVNGDLSSGYIFVRDENGNNYYDIKANSAGKYVKTFTATTNTVKISVYLNNSATAKTVSLDAYGMLCTSADYAISSEIVPYAMSNRELTEEVETNKNNISKDEAALVELVDAGAKNLLQNTAVSQSMSGVTFTVNSDKSVTLSGRATGNITSFFIGREVPALTGNMVLSGCPKGGSTNTYKLDILDGTPNGSVLFEDFGEGANVDWKSITTGIYTARIRIGSGTTVDGLTFKPMLCTKTAWDISQQYVPHRPSYDELIARIEALEAGT